MQGGVLRGYLEEGADRVVYQAESVQKAWIWVIGGEF